MEMKHNPVADFFNLIYPNQCLVCNESLIRNEHHICMTCLSGIPRTNYHLMPDNPIEKRFWGKVPVHRATAFFFFQKGSPFQKLLHALKYKGNKEIGEALGKYAGADLLDSADFAGIDVIIPVPLHPDKLVQRGYNQSEWIGKGLSHMLAKPQDTTALLRLVGNTTQTKKSVYERYANTEGIFGLSNKHALSGKHILLIDDVLTTGSTLEACINALLDADNVKISIFTLAMA